MIRESTMSSLLLSTMNMQLATFLYLLLVFSKSTQAFNCSIQTNFHNNTYNNMTFTFAQIDPRQAISPEIKFHPDFLFCYGSVNPDTGMPSIEPPPSAADLSAERICLPFVNASVNKESCLIQDLSPTPKDCYPLTTCNRDERIMSRCLASSYHMPCYFEYFHFCYDSCIERSVPVEVPEVKEDHGTEDPADHYFCESDWYSGENYVHRLGCLSGVAIQSPRNFSARCRINAFKDSVVSTDELQSVEYRWAVLQETAGGWQFLESAELVHHGDIQFLVDLNSISQPRFKCYVERVERGDRVISPETAPFAASLSPDPFAASLSPDPTTNFSYIEDITNLTYSISGIGINDPYLPLVIDPEENFLTRSLWEYSFSVEEAASSLTAERPHRGRCSVSVYAEPETVKYAKYIWLAMVFDKYSHSKDLGNTSVWLPSDGRTEYMTRTNNRTLINVTVDEFWEAGPAGGVVTCVLSTAIGLIEFPPKFIGRAQGNQVAAPAVPVTIYVLVGCGALLLVLLAGFLYTRYKKFKNTVIIKVYRNPDYQFDMPEIHVPSGYLPMSEIRYGEGSISSDLTMSTDFSSELPVSASSSRHRFSSDCSSVDSNRPGISVQNPTEKYQPFEVEISKLAGDPGKVMLKDHGFNVFVPDELKRLRVNHRRITMHEMVGFGNFGQVHRGTLTQSTGLRTLVAVKVLKDNATFESLKDLVVEGTCMALVGAHQNLVVLLAVSLRSKNPCLITEFCLHGNMKDFIKRVFSTFEPQLEECSSLIYKWASEIAAGVEFLHSKKIVHRDLACRNILVTEELSCKVSDFGLARDMGDSLYYSMKTMNTPLPYRWLALEVFGRSKFNGATDVWAFAVTLWELAEYGAQPYGDLPSMNVVVEFVRSGGRLTMPSWVDQQLSSLVSECFNERPSSRPSMSHMTPVLRSIAQRMYQPSALQVLKQRLTE